MHYYKFNIADWAKDTGHLSLKEEAILLRLINWYLDNESHIPTKTQMVLRKLRLADESETVGYLIEEFFKKHKDGWHNEKLDKVINEYQSRAERNRKNGKTGGRPKNKDLAKPSGFPDGNQVGTETKPTGNLNQEPLTTNQEPLTTNQEPLTNKEITLSENSDAITVLTYFNEVCGTKYKSTTKSHIENINQRLREGHTVDDCRKVIDHKHNEWADDSRMAGYLRPQTLFGTGKFQGYLMAASAKPKNDRRDLSDQKHESGRF